MKNSPEEFSETGLDERFPHDPVILASTINMKLRDEYPGGLDDLCDDLNINRMILEKRLSEAGFEYLPEINQFR